MKTFKGIIEAVTMDGNGDNIIKTRTETIVPAENRQKAMYTMLDMGQAMARSCNDIKNRALYFRLINLIEINSEIE